MKEVFVVVVGSKSLDNLLASCDFLHAIQSTAGLEPGDLKVVEAVIQLDLFRFSISMLDFSSELLAGCKAVQSQD